LRACSFIRSSCVRWCCGEYQGSITRRIISVLSLSPITEMPAPRELLSWRKKLISSTRLPNCSSLPATSSSSPGSDTTTRRHFLVGIPTA